MGFPKGSGLIFGESARPRDLSALFGGIAPAISPRSPAQCLLKSSCFSFRGRHMGSMSLMHWLVVLAIVLVLFGAGKLPRVMGDFAKGIKAFKSGMKEEDEAAATTPPAQVTPPAGAAASTASAGVGDRSRDHA